MARLSSINAVHDFHHWVSTSEVDTLLFHTDMAKVGVFDTVKTREQMLADHLRVILDSCDGRTVLFPTFNYSFCRNGIYDVAGDPCQVGVLNEYARLQAGVQNRTLTPVFNFAIFGDGWPMAAASNPFGSESTFANLAEKKGWIVFWGASVASNTFLHYVEETISIGYRYIKPFKGVIRHPQGEQVITLEYRVRPMTEDELDYDWPRLIFDLEEKKILIRIKLDTTWVAALRSDLLLAFWQEQMKQDLLYLLSPLWRERTMRFYQQFGEPLTFSRVEAEKAAGGA